MSYQIGINLCIREDEGKKKSFFHDYAFIKKFTNISILDIE